MVGCRRKWRRQNHHQSANSAGSFNLKVSQFYWLQATPLERRHAINCKNGVGAIKLTLLLKRVGTPLQSLTMQFTLQSLRKADILIIDTAGRLATQDHLMEELRKVKRVIGKALPGAPHHTLSVLDGNTGQNGLSQVKAFHAALGLTAIIVTKLDGTAKGGVICALCPHPKEEAQTSHFGPWQRGGKLMI
jgi:hypothetical protein